MKKLFFLATAIFISGCTAPNDEKIRLGAILPLTGGMAEMGLELQKSLIAEVEFLNKNGGILERDLEIIFEDGQCNPGVATAAAQKLVRVEKVPVILGGLCSPETLGAAPIAEKNRVILITSVSGAESISDAGDFIFRNAPEGNTNGQIIADHASALGLQKIALVNELSDFPLSVKKTFLENYDGEIFEENFAPGTMDFRTVISKIENEKPDALFFNPQQNQSFKVFLKQLVEAQWSGQLFFNNTVVGNPALYEEIEDFLQKNDAIAGSYDVVPNPQQTAVLERFETQWNRPALFRHLLANQHDSLHLILAAMKKTGDENDTEGIRDFLYGVENFVGASGTFSIDENGDAGKSYSLVKFDGTEFRNFERKK
ncbi:ABC transporter substrate-binding protein [bacterium]|jgi:branched-chain amino acid transport system substrate-binding protein|nr:ABC transporter substrate-binding protein [bacterium]MBT6831513.1 ABC transporter substrate-binding protein [bacterium]MBT6996163.1 ABC transporter substrate-binding protein [bacterium]MBT7772546.1 ABC transporter substrate-binding protein [bacterium]